MGCADLICIGSQKAGTTWLHRALIGHPRVFAPVLKEVHYFDSIHVRQQRTFQQRRADRAARLLSERVDRTVLHRFVARQLERSMPHSTTGRYLAQLRFCAGLGGVALDDDWYRGLFAAARPDQLTCDFTTAYALLPPKGIAHIARINPRARILFIIRDPVDRALSHARMLLVREAARPTADMLERYVYRPTLRAHDKTIAILDRWQAGWPAEQFHVLFFDDIAQRPAGVLEEVCAFAGLEYDKRFFARPNRVVFRGPRIEAGAELRAELRARFTPTYDELARRYPDRGFAS